MKNKLNASVSDLTLDEDTTKTKSQVIIEPPKPAKVAKPARKQVFYSRLKSDRINETNRNIKGITEMSKKI